MFMKDFNKQKRMLIQVLALIFALIPACVASANMPPQRILTDGRRCVELVFEEKFTEAHQLATGLVRQFPDNPAGYFFRAAIFHYQMLHLRNNVHERAFYEACNQGIQIGERNRSQNCQWNNFFLGATIGVQGAFERVNGRLVSSLRLATRAMEIFEELNADNVRDVLYGTGVYEYWIGANAKLLWWMPGAKDNRPRALRDLETVRNEGVFTRLIVNYDLMEMYLNERRRENDAIRIANGVLARYPSNTVALWALFEAYDSQGETEKRDAIGARILEKIQQESNNEQMLRHFNRRTRRH